ncbi:MAG TPA: EF-P lysine aminoacylase EpmA [Syntrophales bacterium]|nr:EF-P lysine aminoacylase EpmA [Syntrophales bacterium]
MEQEESWLLAGRRRALDIRARMIEALRRFFLERDYLEVETPARIPAPAPETHIEPVPSGDWFLHPSPELCMKRLLAAGYPRIFQICRCFRAGERGDRHLPEFTMLEWYRRGIDSRELMDECEALVRSVAEDLGMGDVLSCRGKPFRLSAPWPRLSVRDAFAAHASISPEEALRQERFEEVLAFEVEPLLGRETPLFLHSYPMAHASLARADRDDPSVAERFELYMAGMELANGFAELTDPVEQRRRFDEARAEVERRVGTAPPQPERFLRALERMPEASGIALGVDRLAMVFCDAATIDEVVAFPPEIL